MAEEIARYYVADRNPEQRALPGVPLANITQERFDGFPAWLQESIDALEGEGGLIYLKTPPAAPKPTKKTEPTVTAAEAPQEDQSNG